uniref:3-hydroxyisobutyryl-CoA hydrolase n=1 Tax=Panagrolaimus davidi TaxID=227884 RepID=A0A914P4S7_9BILA
MSSLAELQVLFDCENAARIITLNRPKALTALNLSMVRQIYPKMKEWMIDENAAVIQSAKSALECGNIDVALKEIDKAVGNQIVEYSYQRRKNFDILAFFYFITGNVEKLQRKLKVVERLSRKLFHCTLSCVKRCRTNFISIFNCCNIWPDQAEKLRTQLEEANLSIPEVDPNVRLLDPPPRAMTENWPLFTVTKGPFDVSLIALGTA